MADLSPLAPSGWTQGRDPQDLLMLVQKLLTGLSATRIPTIQMRPFQFPSLEHLDERVVSVVRHALDVRGLSEKTTLSYTSAYRMFRRYVIETNKVHTFLAGESQSQVTVLEGWVAWLRARGVNHTTVNNYWRSLNAPFTRIAEQDGSFSPTRLMPTPRPGTSLPEFLTRDGLRSVLRFVRNYQWAGGEFERARNVALIAVMGLGGCRLREVMRMQVEDVDVRSPTPTIRIKRGKGRNGGKPRVVCLPPALIAAMTTYLHLRAQRGLTTDRAFVSVRGDLPIAEVTIRRLCRLITAKLGFKVRPHLLRHTCATLMRQEGVADRLAMEQLGHSTLGVLQRYSHIAPGERAATMSRIKIGLVDEEDELPLFTSDERPAS